MNSLERKQAIELSLNQFGSLSLEQASLNLFAALGYESERRLPLRPNTPDNFVATFAQQRSLNRDQALLDHWRTADFLFQLTDDEVGAAIGGSRLLPFESRAKWNGAIIESYLFLAIELHQPRYTRTQLAVATRAVNRLFDMPAMLLFKHDDSISLAIINRRPHRRDESRDILEKVSLIKDIRYSKPHRAHIEILFDLSLPELYQRYPFQNFVELHAAWQKALDTSELNKRFYKELANWYFWALDHVRFPKDAPKDADGRDSLSLIRLITRLIFCWFLREKGLISEALFDETKVRSLLVSLKEEENSYYTAILQNLFFATLNTEMDEPGKQVSRRFIAEGKEGQQSDDHMVHHVWRYRDRIRDQAAFERLFRSIPFLNGGLFECLDERVEQGKSVYTKEIRIDGFSVMPGKQPRVPNFLFFGPERRVDLSKAYGEVRYTQASVRPLIPLLERYKFTVSENTPIEEEVALDPELLGHVFENLLAAYNPETDTTARKTTGSFYTPRVVVDFMVDESLIAYFAPRLQEAFPKPPDREPSLRQVLSYTSATHEFNDAEVRALVDAIDQVKILDPACGSGAFPMGALHKLVFILSKLDPGNGAWKERQLAKARELDVGRDAAMQAIEDAFARDQGDYARKLYLIENCLYGVDIQPIAVQIAKLRCFISLTVEQQSDDLLPNRGILPLPNLETKFIAANTLFGLHRGEQMQLVAQDITAKKSELRRIRHEHFLARRYRDKKTLRKRDQQLRAELANLLTSSLLLTGPEAKIVASWDPYHADSSAPFFDPEWMFSLKGQQEASASNGTGFDIVIGNPPYVRQEELKNMRAFEGTALEGPLKDALKDDYFCYTGVADLYVYFYERSLDLLRVGGVLCFISSNKYFRSAYGERLRHFLAACGELRLLIDFGDAIVFTSIAYPSILLVRKMRPTHRKDQLPLLPKMAQTKDKTQANAVRALTWESGSSIDDFPEVLLQHGFAIPQHELQPDGWRLESRVTLRLLEKLHRAGPPLGEYVQGRFYYGIKTGLNEAFVVDRATRDRLIAEHKSSAEVLKPFLRGRDVKRWRIESQDLWLVFVPWHFPLHGEASIQGPSQKAEREFRSRFPAVYKHLYQFRDQLSNRNPSETGVRYEWYALQRWAAEYWHEFEEFKIVIPSISDDVNYAVDRNKYYSNDKTSICVAEDLDFLAGLLNSKLLWWVIRKEAATKQGGYYEFKPMYVSQLPVAMGSQSLASRIRSLVCEIAREKQGDAHAHVSDLESKLDGLVAHLYGLTEGEFRMILEDLTLPDPVRVGALNSYRDIARTVRK